MTSTLKLKIGTQGHSRGLKKGWTLWDTRVPGFCARRRNGTAVIYALKYRTSEGRQRPRCPRPLGNFVGNYLDVMV